jgi:hypothetical protein
MILLVAADAAHVAGPSIERPDMAGLTPLPLKDGRFYLPVAVLSDPDHRSTGRISTCCLRPISRP